MKLCAFRCLISRPQILSLRYKNQIRKKLLLSRKLRYFRGSRLSTAFNTNSLLLIRRTFFFFIYLLFYICFNKGTHFASFPQNTLQNKCEVSVLYPLHLTQMFRFCPTLPFPGQLQTKRHNFSSFSDKQEIVLV